MPRLIPISGKKLIRILQKEGFEIIRINGSHNFLYNKFTNKSTTVPLHRNEDIGQGLIRQILRDVDMGVDEFEELRRKV